MMWVIQLFSGVNWASLPYTSLLLLELCIWATVSYVGLMLALNVYEMLSMRYGSHSSLVTSLDWRLKSGKLRRQVNKWIPLLSMLIVGYVLGSAQLFSPIREKHNVAVLSKDAERVYTVQYENEAKPTTIRLCWDGDDLPLKTGMVIEPFQYVQEKDCLHIDERTYIDYWRNPKRDVVDRDGKLLFAKEN